MPVRIKITLLFIVYTILLISVGSGSIYYFSLQTRNKAFKKMLVNRAIISGQLLEQKDLSNLAFRIDSITRIALERKIIQAYDNHNNEIYRYADESGDTVKISNQILREARRTSPEYFNAGDKEAVAYHYAGKSADLIIISAAEDEQGKKILSDLKRVLLLHFIFSMIIIAPISYLISGVLLKPVKKITSDVQEISAQNLSRRIETGIAKDEWHELASTLNELLNRLQSSFEMQNRFISNASHELSTPLTAISNQLEISLQRERSSEEYKQVISSIYQDIRHLVQLTQTLLEFAKASGTPEGLQLDKIRMDEILLELPSQISKYNNTWAVTIEFAVMPDDEEHLIVYGNKALLLTALKNIIINACKYSIDNKATVTLEPSKEEICIYVRDHGQGIPNAELKNIFQPFYRINVNDSQPGSGVGLTLSERIIKLHKGRILVSSKENEGTEFKVCLTPASLY